MSTQIGYVPPPSIGHELGVMFGFMGIFLIAMTVYYFVWQARNKKSLREERERIAAVRQKEAGLGGGEKSGL